MRTRTATPSSPATRRRSRLIKTLFKDIRYDPQGDFAPLTTVVSAPLVLVVNPENPKTANIKTVADLVAAAKAAPGALAYGSGGNGNLAHLAMELLSQKAGIKMIHVPYRGGSAAEVGILAQEVLAVFDPLSAVPLVKAGKLRALAVSSAERLPALPDVPTVAEAGYPGFDISFWVGFFMPKATPAPILETLHREIVAAAKRSGGRREGRLAGRRIGARSRLSTQPRSPRRPRISPRSWPPRTSRRSEARRRAQPERHSYSSPVICASRSSSGRCPALIFSRASSSVNHSARSTSGKTCRLPLRGGHSISKLLLRMLCVSISSSAANAVTNLPPRCLISTKRGQRHGQLQPSSSENSRRAAVSASSSSAYSPFGIDHAPRSLLRQNGPPG